MAANLLFLCSQLLKRKRPLCDLTSQRMSKYLLLQNKDHLQSVKMVIAAIFATKCVKKRKGPNEDRNHSWWEHGYQNWTDAQFKKRLRVTRDTFQFVLDAIGDDIRKETTRFKEPKPPELQLALTLYRLSHGCTYTTVGDLFGVGTSTACTIFISVIKTVVRKLYDSFVVLPKSEEEWKEELTLFLEDWEFPCVGAWDGFHVFINCHLKNFFSFKKRYSVTNMGLIASNKRFLWAGVGAPGSMQSLLLQLEIQLFPPDLGCLKHSQIQQKIPRRSILIRS